MAENAIQEVRQREIDRTEGAGEGEAIILNSMGFKIGYLNLLENY